MAPVSNSFPESGSFGPIPFTTVWGFVSLFSISISSPGFIVAVFGRKIRFPWLSFVIIITATIGLESTCDEDVSVDLLLLASALVEFVVSAAASPLEFVF
jgi:hypothetical protein